MRIELQLKDDVCTILLNGPFIAGSKAACTRAQEALEATGCRKVIADCRNTPYLDAAGIGSIVGLYKSFRNLGGQFVLANVSPHIRKVLEISRLDNIIPIFDDAQTALAALNGHELHAPAARRTAATRST